MLFPMKRNQIGAKKINGVEKKVIIVAVNDVLSQSSALLMQGNINGPLVDSEDDSTVKTNLKLIKYR